MMNETDAAPISPMKGEPQLSKSIDSPHVSRTEPIDNPYPLHPFETAGWLSWVFFWWTVPLMEVGAKKALELSDFLRAPVEDTPEYLSAHMCKEWEREVSQKKGLQGASLFRAMIRAFRKQYSVLGIITIFYAALMLFIPFGLSRVVKVLTEGSNATDADRYGWASALVVSNILFSILHHHLYFRLHRFGFRMRVALQSLIYTKVTSLSLAAVDSLSTGLIINTMGSDMQVLEDALTFSHFVWTSVPVGAVCFYVMWTYVNYATLAGFGCIVFQFAIQSITTTLFTGLRMQYVKHKDQRVKHVNEIVTAIRLIKMYTWEPALTAVINHLRLQEVAVIFQSNLISALIHAAGFIFPLLIGLVTFVTYHALGGDLTAEKVYGTLAFLYPTRTFISIYAPLGLRGFAEVRVIMTRVERLLKADEKPRRFLGNGEGGPGIKVQDAVMGWNSAFSLRDISFSVSPGEVVGVIGKVGSGKSTLLQLLLGEAVPDSGTVHVNGSVAYASQVPWILADTVRNNIVFGRTFDAEWYNTVVHACALTRDIQMWPQREESLIGERGVTLSGGQKARISLARAVYGRASVYLLDDPFSAVDVKVGHHIFNNVISNLLRDCTVVLVTHHQQFLRKVNRVVVLEDGKVRKYGRFDEISSELTDVHNGLEADAEETEIAIVVAPSTALEDESHEMETPPKEQTAEDRSVGSVTWSTYKQYILTTLNTQSSLFAFTVWFFVTCGPQALCLVSDGWLATWSALSPKERHNTGDYYPRIYGLLVAGSVVAVFLRACFTSFWMTNASKDMHNKMLHCLLRAPTLFFDQTPAGRILNRFSQDLAIADEQLQTVVRDFLQSGANTAGQVLFVCVLNPYLFIAVVPLILVFIWIRSYYVKTQREVKRFQSITRSPIYSHFSETLTGLCTLRSLNAQGKFTATCHRLINDHQKVCYMYASSARWLGFRLDGLCIVFMTCVVFFAVTSTGETNTGNIGMSLLYVVQLVAMLQWLVRQSTEAEGLMTSVERVLSYTHIPSEAQPEVPMDGLIPLQWPREATVTFRAVALRYSHDSALVLKGISLEIPASYKVGVVGRTGAGKSSLIAALFRLTELSGGDISIDGIDCSRIGLRRLRGTFCVIPQEPFLFTATVAANLDPFKQYSEEELWRVLAQAQLEDHIRRLEGGLQHQISEGGGNMSVGQRQLICLARALLQKAKILIMDEATASVDLQTDAVIQACIRSSFASCTVITVAHRLDTIIQSDRIIVLDGGSLKEFDAPHKLLQDPSSIFTSLVEETGAVNCARLRSLAKEKYTLSTENVKND